MAIVAEIMVQTLKELGVKYIFGVPSGSWIDYLSVIENTDGIEFILVSNEGSAGFMADVCWRLTGNVAACFGTFGPGACNLTTGVCGGYLDRSPMIVLTDEMSDSMLGRITQMNIDHQQLFKPITKWTTRLGPENVRQTLYKAFSIATTEVPGPVHIGLPQGIANKTISADNSHIIIRSCTNDPDQKVLGEIERLFMAASKPVIMLGNTCNRFEIYSDVQAIAEKFKIPVVLTPMAKGQFNEDSDFYAGVLAHALANIVGETHKQADLIIGIGYDPVEINYEEWMPQVPLLHIDTRQADIDETKIPNCCNIMGDIKLAIQRLLTVDCAPKKWDINSVKSRKNLMFDKFEAFSSSFGPTSVISALRKVFPTNGILTCDVGAHLHLIGQQWKAYSPKNILITNGCSSMGFAIPAAIAAKLSCPDREVCCIVGDGGFYMSAGELATATRLNLKIVFIILNDKSLSLIRIKQQRKSYNQYGVQTITSDEKATIHSDSIFGIRKLNVQTKEEFNEALNYAFSANTLTVIEAFINSSDYDELVLKGNR